MPRGTLQAAAVAIAVCAAVATFVLAGHRLLRLGHDGPITNPTDFRAFYCAAKVTAQGKNPYLSEPLRTCEQRALNSVGLVGLKRVAIPAPLPPYALAALRPMTALPYLRASVAWFALLVLCLCATVILLYRLTGIAPLIVALVVFPVDGFASLVIGQIVPLVLCLLCGAALCLRNGRVIPGTLLTAASMIEPHIGFPACLALFVWEPRAFVPLLGAFVALAGLSVGALGPHTAIDYFTTVLPAHAHSEIANFDAQYSLTSALHALGLADSISLNAGAISYFIALAVGAILGGKLAERFDDRAYLVLAPPVAVMIGGVFLHGHQIAFALPLALLLFVRFRSVPTRLAVATLLVCLAVPWESIAEIPQIARLAPQPATIAVLGRQRNDAKVLAEASWEAWIRGEARRDARAPAELWLVKLPTWFALLALLGYGFAALAPTDVRDPDALNPSVIRKIA